MQLVATLDAYFKKIKSRTCCCYHCHGLISWSAELRPTLMLQLMSAMITTNHYDNELCTYSCVWLLLHLQSIHVYFTSIYF